MKNRLLVMNGQRIIQHEQGTQWHNDKVEKAGTLKPGIYNIYLATQADKAKSYDGVILHADKSSVFQQVGKSYVKHERKDFDKIPEIGSNINIRYEQERAIASVSAVKQGRRLTQ